MCSSLVARQAHNLEVVGSSPTPATNYCLTINVEFMKTMKQKGQLPIRVKESDVNAKLAQGFEFCPKSEWKEKVRNVTVEKVEKTESAENKPKAKKAKGNPKGKAKKTK